MCPGGTTFELSPTPPGAVKGDGSINDADDADSDTDDDEGVTDGIVEFKATANPFSRVLLSSLVAAAVVGRVALPLSLAPASERSPAFPAFFSILSFFTCFEALTLGTFFPIVFSSAL